MTGGGLCSFNTFKSKVAIFFQLLGNVITNVLSCVKVFSIIATKNTPPSKQRSPPTYLPIIQRYHSKRNQAFVIQLNFANAMPAPYFTQCLTYFETHLCSNCSDTFCYHSQWLSMRVVLRFSLNCILAFLGGPREARGRELLHLIIQHKIEKMHLIL